MPHFVRFIQVLILIGAATVLAGLGFFAHANWLLIGIIALVEAVGYFYFINKIKHNIDIGG